MVLRWADVQSRIVLIAVALAFMMFLVPALLPSHSVARLQGFFSGPPLPPYGDLLRTSKGSHDRYHKVCVIEPSGKSDSAPAIIHALNECGRNGPHERGVVIFKNETYHILSVMNTTGLSNLDIEHHGTLLWSTDIPYWLTHSLPVGYQNQSSAWLFGGDNIHWNGYSYGTLDGNGQVW